MHSALLALDWGTSSLRAYRLGPCGRLLERRHLPWGIMNLPRAQCLVKEEETGAAFERALGLACGDWLHADPQLPLIACGMVGSAQGWRETPYLGMPARLDSLATRLERVPRAGATPLHIIAGLIQQGPLPNVMRGEETQVAGVLASLTTAHGSAQDLLICLPGTHSKWVRVQGSEVRHFDSFMTGEIYALLRSHSILGRTMHGTGTHDAQAFGRGVETAASQAVRLGPLSTAFSTRTLGLAGELTASAQADYLSGLLIGHEVAAMASVLRSTEAMPRIVLCGDEALCTRYARALSVLGFETPLQMPAATERGLWHIASLAGLA